MNNIIASASAIVPAPFLAHEEAATAAPAPAPATAPATGDDEEKKDSKSFSGFIFLCNGMTKPECYRYRVFGLPLSKVEVVEKIKTGAKLFLFDFDSKLLYGVYEATSNGKVGLEPLAFGGKFPAQVQFRIYKGCLPLHETSFKHVIKDNYKGTKFKQELDEHQVINLVSLFRPLFESSSSAAPIPHANICSTLPNMGPPKGIRPLAMMQQVRHLTKLPFGKDPFFTRTDQGYVRNIQLSQHGWQGSVPIRGHVPSAIDPRFAAPTNRYYTADSQRHVTNYTANKQHRAPSYPYYIANTNFRAPIHQYYTADVQKPNIAAQSHPYHTADSQQLNATALSHQHYSTDSLNPNVSAPSHPSCTADSQQLNAATHIQQHYSTNPQQPNVQATSHPCLTASAQLLNATAPSHPCLTADGAAQLGQESYFRSMQEAVPQDKLTGSHHDYMQLPQQMMHQPTAAAFNSHPMPPAPLLTQPDTAQAAKHDLNATPRHIVQQ